MSTVLLINGSPHKEGCTYTALMEVGKTLQENGVKTELLWLENKPLFGCIGCGKCQQTHRCVVDDAVNRVLERIDEFDGIIVGSPVHYAGPSSQSSAFLNRFFNAAGGSVAGKPGAAVVSCRRGGATDTFDKLNKYFAKSNMPIVTSQYWNQVHGTSPEEVRQDLEGMQTMRTLGQNMAWLMKCIACGKENGIAVPKYEPALRTNYIR